MKTLFIDLETFSKVDIKVAGAYRYAEDCEIILFGWAYDSGAVQYLNTLINPIPPAILKDLTDPLVLKVAHNAPFEMAVLSKCLKLDIKAGQWWCTSVLAASAGYPLSLDAASQAMGLTEKKDKSGSALIRYFCIPCKPTKANGGRVRNLPCDDLLKWDEFIDYLLQDVVVCRSIFSELSWVETTPFERNLWVLDQKINQTGVCVNLELANNAIAMNGLFRERLTLEAEELTSLSNVNSVAQIKAWLQEKEGISIDSLDKESVQKLMKTVKSGDASRILELRSEMSKSSVSKYTAVVRAAGEGTRVRGLLQFCGAGRTHRWAGRLLQIQNLPRISMKNKDLDVCRELVLAGEMEWLEVCYGAIPAVLSQLIRTALVPKTGSRFIVSDFSAIEARVIAWLAGEEWRLKIFREGGDIYIASAAAMFNIPLKSIKKGDPIRQKGKVAELACGYQGGPNAIEVMDTKGEIPKADYLPIVKAWRAASPKIVKLWYALDDAAKMTIRTGQKIIVKTGDGGVKNLSFSMSRGTLLMNLPSGRSLHYPGAFLKDHVKTFKKANGEVYDKEVEIIHFYASNQTTRKWEVSDTYGGKLAENLTQAVARDCLAVGMVNLDAVGYNIVGHVHDEVITEMPVGVGSLEEVNKLIIKPAPWMQGLPMNSEGFEGTYYKKD